MNTKLKLFLATAILVLGGLQSCRQPDYMSRVPIFRALGPDGTESSEVNIGGKAQSVIFTVFSSAEWTAEVKGDDSFSLPTRTGGSGKTDLVLNVSSNETGVDRKAVLDIVQGSTVKSFNIVQTEQTPYLEIVPKTYAASGDGESFTIGVDTNQPAWECDLDGLDWVTVEARSADGITLKVAENTSGRKRSADIRFFATEAPELMDYLELTQNVPAVAPTAELLDVAFTADGKAHDVSAMGMTVDCTRLDGDVSTYYSNRYNRYVAKFNNPSIARSGLATGYYFIPYTTSSTFASKLSDGYSYELVFCSYTEPTAKQVKPFASTQAGGTGMCFRGSTGEINFELHVGGSWVELYSGILPAKGEYYHVVATWDSVNGIALLYVNGELTATKNTTGAFKFMDTSVDARWFGIGADPSASDKGEASFYGEVVIARLYDAPISSEEVKALYKLVR